MDTSTCPNCGSEICTRQPYHLTIQRIVRFVRLFLFRCVRCRSEFYRFRLRNVLVLDSRSPCSAYQNE